MSEFWNDQRTAILIRMWEAGASGAEIARATGAASRNSVLGKVYRLRQQGQKFARAFEDAAQTAERRRLNKGGFSGRMFSPAKAPKVRPVLARREGRGVVDGIMATTIQRNAEARANWRDRQPVAVDLTKAKPWVERGFGECTWIVQGEGADAVSCCQPVHKRGWCQAHYGVGTNHEPPSALKGLERVVMRAAA